MSDELEQIGLTITVSRTGIVTIAQSDQLIVIPSRLVREVAVKIAAGVQRTESEEEAA